LGKISYVGPALSPPDLAGGKALDLTGRTVRKSATQDYANFEDLVLDFLRQAGEVLHGRGIGAAGFGVAGALVDGCHHSGNLPWHLDVEALAWKLGLRQIVVINDLTATAFALEKLPTADAPLWGAAYQALATRNSYAKSA
jgi:glucokinase